MCDLYEVTAWEGIEGDEKGRYECYLAVGVLVCDRLGKS